MFENLVDIDDKLSRLEQQLSDPNVINDQKLYGNIVREHSHVSKLHDLYSQYCHIQNDIQENKQTSQRRK